MRSRKIRTANEVTVEVHETRVRTWAKMYSSAGATSVLASLWSVDDESTKEFMIHFYTELAAGQSKVASLQSAQITLMKNPRSSHPLYWAPFVLMGDWR